MLKALRKYLAILFFLPVVYVFICLCLSRYYYREAGFGLQKNVALAIESHVHERSHSYLLKAEAFLPTRIASFLCQGDLQRIHTALGEICYERGKEVKLDTIDLYVQMQQSHEHYKIAININPHDILAVQGIAKTVAELEFAFAELFPGKTNKYNALPLFERVLEIEPNGITPNYSTARYLLKKGLRHKLFAQVQHATKVYPVYTKIKKESFYSTETKEAVRLGMHEAIKAKIMLVKAYSSLSIFHEEGNRFPEAIEYCEKALNLQKAEKTSQQHLRFGRLLLQTKDIKRVNYEFFAALKNKSTFSKNLNTIFHTFKKNNNIDGFIKFATFAKANSIKSVKLNLFIAQAQIEKKHFKSAKETLLQINAQNQTPKAYFMLANIAKQEKDWDSMEINIQKATVLDPTNNRYFSILADALIYQKKYKSAAEYMQKALANDPENQKYRKKLDKIKSYND